VCASNDIVCVDNYDMTTETTSSASTSRCSDTAVLSHRSPAYARVRLPLFDYPPEQNMALVGEVAVGKSSYVRRAVNDQFLTACPPTIGTDFSLMRIEYSDGWSAVVQLFDTAGGDSARSMPRLHLRLADAVVLVHDASRLDTLFSLVEWNDVVARTAPRRVIKVIVGTHADAQNCDLDRVVRKTESAATLLDAHGWWITSAASDINIIDSLVWTVRMAVTGARPLSATSSSYQSQETLLSTPVIVYTSEGTRSNTRRRCRGLGDETRDYYQHTTKNTSESPAVYGDSSGGAVTQSMHQSKTIRVCADRNDASKISPSHTTPHTYFFAC
jgi:Ras-related protein Rab-2A